MAQAFDRLCFEAYPTVPERSRPCAFHHLNLQGCRDAAKGTCTRCTAQAAMPAPNPAPAGSLARIKAACTAHLLQFMK